MKALKKPKTNEKTETLEERLTKLKNLKELNLISEDDYQQKKSELLKEI